MNNLPQVLKNIPLFQCFTIPELEKLVAQSQVKTFVPNEVIIEFGQPGKFLGVVLEGMAEAVVTAKNGDRQLLGTLKPGDFLGEMSLLTGEPTTADVIAKEKCQILIIPHDVFSVSLAVNPAAIKLMAKTMSGRIRSRQQNEETQARLKEAWESVSDPYGLKLTTASSMKILVINCGSSSIKFGYYDTGNELNNTEGMIERIGLDNSLANLKTKKEDYRKELGSIDYSEAFEVLFDLLTDREHGVIGNLHELQAVGHRVVHGGDKYSGAVVVNDEVLKQIESISHLAPLHNPINLMGIKACIKLIPTVPQIAVFDTGFHQKMPPHAYLYGIPYDYFEKDRIRRYGFHGISHEYIALQGASYLKRSHRELKVITCHLGQGASICAIDHGRSIDTSMGLTPLEGLIMGTRCGDIDPSLVFYLCKEKGLSIEDVENILNRQSGLKGLSKTSGDLRELEAAASKGDHLAVTALHTFCYRIRKYIGAYVAALGDLDILIFSGGIGQHSAWVRGLSCQNLSHIGIEMDDILNRTASSERGETVDITGHNSRAKILVIPTDEERMIARETIRTLGYQRIDQIIHDHKEQKIPVEVSAHHVHLSQKEVDAIFGNGYILTRLSDLSQPGQFACKETVNLIGHKGKVERVRVLGPLRKQGQVEISMTEEFKLGVKAPIRASGDLQGSPGITIEGSKGECNLSEGVICALRHIHMAPEDALSFGLRDRDIVMVKLEGERSLIFGDVLVRIDPSFRLSMHIDTDEANAAGITSEMMGHIVGVQDRR